MVHHRLLRDIKAAAGTLKQTIGVGERRDPEAGPSPILIYQMGKVGSSTVERSLKGIGRPVVHIHHLNPRTRAAVRRQHEEKGLPTPAHYRAADAVLRDLEQGRQLDVVTLVREPVSRNISAFFQNIRVFGHDPERLGPERVAELTEQFIERYAHHVPLRWFDDELREMLGIDVYARPFPRSRGHTTLESPRARVLILKSELPDPAKAEALATFLGLASPPPIRRANVGAEKGYREVYAAFLDAIRLPADYLDRMYHSRYARHFYDEQELRAFRQRWVRPAGDVPD